MDERMILREIAERRSIRKFQARKVESDKVEALMEAARLAPSVCNLQPLRVLVVDDGENLAFVRKAAYNSGAAVTAPLILVGMVDTGADSTLQEKVTELYQVEAIEPVDMGTLRSAKNKPFQLKLGEEITAMSAAIGLEHLVLQAVHMGLGTCWVHHCETEEIREHFRIPEHLKILTLIMVGYPDESPKPRPRIPDIRFRSNP